jgi:hypothetical protein
LYYHSRLLHLLNWVAQTTTRLTQYVLEERLYGSPVTPVAIDRGLQLIANESRLLVRKRQFYASET